jgi:hypothetical protein
MFLKINSIALFFVLLFIYSCNSEQAEKEKLSNECIAIISKELKNNIKSVIDRSSFGLGSSILDFTMDQKEQDSLIVLPIVKDLKNELNKKSIEELKRIKTNKADRYLLVSTSIFKTSKQATGTFISKTKDLLLKLYVSKD